MPTHKELMQMGSQLIEYCNNGQWRECQQNMYTENAASAEAAPFAGNPAEVQGLEAITAKGDWWESAHEVHSSQAEGPFVFGQNQFSVIFDMDVTNKETGQRSQLREVAQYYVNDAGKIEREEFAYAINEE